MEATRTELISGLRELADWLEAHPELPEPNLLSCELAIWLYDADKFRTYARALDNFDKEEYGIDAIALVRKFGPIKFTAKVLRREICRRVTKLVEQEVWECPDSLLEPEGLTTSTERV